MCVGCNQGAPFDPFVHLRFYTDLTQDEEGFVEQLSWAVWNQDVLHQFESKAHFDNCDFSGGLAYIQTLLSEVGAQASLAGIARDAGDPFIKRRAIRAAYFAMGQALHAIQDFYAHTNFVELSLARLKANPVPKITFLEGSSIPLWYPDSAKRLATFEQSGLVSGYVWWGEPQLCRVGALTHAELAKDTNKEKEYGATMAAFDMTLHELAYRLAVQSTENFIDYVWEVWPILRIGPPGKFVVVALPVGGDRRDHKYQKPK